MLSANRFSPTTVFVLLTLLVSSMATSAQTITGSISGAVADANGGYIPGATVTIVSNKTGQARTNPTNDDGRFTFAALQPGAYSLKIEKQGFQTLEQTGVILSANENLALGEIKLQTGQVSETVSVTTEGTLVERETSDLTARLTSDQLALISTKGRDVTSLLRLLPGTSNIPDVEAVGNGFGTTLPNFSGQRSRSTVATVDGLNASEPSGSNLLSLTTSIDAIGEVKVLRDNYSAEYGNNGGAIEEGGSSTGNQFITDCTFSGNSAAGNGGAVDATGPSLTISGSTFDHNSSANSGPGSEGSRTSRIRSSARSVILHHGRSMVSMRCSPPSLSSGLAAWIF